MNNIYDFNDYVNNNNEEMSKFLNDFQEILETPDELFDELYPIMKEELIKTSKSDEYKKELKNKFSFSVNEEEIVNSLNKCKDYLNSEEVKTNLSKNKIEFINLILDLSAEGIKGIPYREKVEIFVEKCHDNARIPTYANPTDAGCDVYAIENTVIPAGKTKIIPTGLKVAVPAGWMLSVRPRSGMSAKTNIRVANAPGTIDSGYRNEVGIILHNTGTTDYTINEGDRIAQFVVELSPMIKFSIVEDINSINGNRGGGFGSTGK